MAGRKLILCVVACATLAAPTSATAGLTIVQADSVQTGESAQGTSQVECPGGSKVAGGGVFTTGGALDTAISTSYPDGDDSWREYTDVFDGPHNHSAYAICDTGKVTRKSETQNIAANKTKTIKVSCPSGKNVYGGGFYTSGLYAETDTMISKPTRTGWQAKIHSFRDTGPVAAQAYVLCGPKETKVVTKPETIPAVDNESATAVCKGNDRLSGGGAAVSGKSASAWISTLYPTSETAWRAYGENGTGDDLKVKSYALCR